MNTPISIMTTVSHSLLATTLLAVVLTSVTLPSHAETRTVPELPLSVPEQNRLGIRFEPLGQPRTLIQARLPGITDVLPAQRQMLLIPFESRIERWDIQSGQLVSKGQKLVQLHSHDGLEFLQGYRRLTTSSTLCDERLDDLKQRQRNGLSARLDVQEKALECQQLRDETISNGEVFAHLPNEWRNQTKAEFTLSAKEVGWVMSLQRPAGALNPAGESLAEFWPGTALRVRTQLTPAQLTQLRQQPDALRVSLIDSIPDNYSGNYSGNYSARISRLGEVANASGLFSVWLEIPAYTPRPGQRWQVHLPAGQPGWVIPASARIRAEQAQWMFVRTNSGVQPMAINPIAEGSGSVLLNNQSASVSGLSNQRSIAISGTSALRSLWLAGGDGE